MHLYENRNVVGRKTTKQWNVANVAVVWSKKLLLSPSLLPIWVKKKKEKKKEISAARCSAAIAPSTGAAQEGKLSGTRDNYCDE